MNKTKDEIVIKITQKDKIYLSVILCLICVIACVCILAPRYYQLKNQNSTTPPTLPGDSSASQQPNNSANYDNSMYASLYSTSVINSLNSLGMPYSTLSRHLDSHGYLNVIGLQISEAQLWVLEELALPIYTTISSLSTNQTPLTIELINNNNLLYSQIVKFSNELNSISG